jgi:hypothetical protein
MQADNLTIEELAATYPYQRRYYWNGKRLQILKSLPNRTFLGFGRWRSRSAGTPRASRSLWFPFLSVIALLLVTIRLYCRVTLTSPIFNLVLSMTIAIVILIVITLWLFDQG